jgi:hypothetical protein
MIHGESNAGAVRAQASGIDVIPTAEAAAGLITVFAVAATLVARGRRRLSAGAGAHSRRR